ncbi:hypothetical protein [Amycolatopsis sp. H20-H5]|uniref:hypothetical protein n=1 Tax=Amycolatopsis sp. H20-H5 TaxID=3046309 RepID=UPI002DB8381D|nr:hypothetical protein [Amycolatopsis sp. H20-H5]MEC3978830.1 hypothetical protein [Amycolatopsis sp. H20-H5]
MRKVSGILLVGLCLGAVGAMVFVPQLKTASPRPIAITAMASPSSPAPPPSPSLTPEPKPKSDSSASSVPPEPQQDAPSAPDKAALDALVPGGKVSAIVFDRVTGKTTLSVREDTAYTSASLVKLLIATEVLTSGTTPAATVGRMLSHSDDNIANALWVVGGGPQIVTRWASRMGLTSTRAPADPGRWGDTLITASDVVRIYRYLLDDAPASIRTTILTALRGATEQGADGFRQYFGIPDGADGLQWAVKQGWSCCRPTRILHTSGLLGQSDQSDRFVVAVLTSQPQSVSYATGSRRVTSVVSALHPLLTQP